ncbi:MAG: hypothetical protein ACI9Q3_001393 [Maribacter sp.]|jgi:hypothetical protein
MDYTLDSVAQTIEALENKLKIKGIVKTPLICSITDLETYNPNTFYFGVVSAGWGFESIAFNCFRESFISIGESSQIIELFQVLYILRESDGNGNTPEARGQFRGFVLTVPPNSFNA